VRWSTRSRRQIGGLGPAAGSSDEPAALGVRVCLGGRGQRVGPADERGQPPGCGPTQHLPRAVRPEPEQLRRADNADPPVCLVDHGLRAAAHAVPGEPSAIHQQARRRSTDGPADAVEDDIHAVARSERMYTCGPVRIRVVDRLGAQVARGLQLRGAPALRR
jgi:hypothetical protein